jgi:type VI secretion system protein ImpJ
LGNPVSNFIDGRLSGTIVHLALPVYQPGAVEADAQSGADVVARWHTAEQTLVDCNAGDRGNVTIEVGRLRFRLLPDGADREGFVGRGVHLVQTRALRRIRQQLTMP